jgi:hypothetical protein
MSKDIELRLLGIRAKPLLLLGSRTLIPKLKEKWRLEEQHFMFLRPGDHMRSSVKLIYVVEQRFSK